MKNAEYAVKLISPLFETDTMIYNRFDLIYRQSVFMVEMADIESDRVWRIPVHVDGKVAFIGIWLVDIPSKVVETACKFIMSYFHVRIVYYINSLCAIDQAELSNQWIIELPDTIEELWNRVSNKNKYNYKRERRKIEDDIGTLLIQEYSEQDIPRKLVEYFFDFKEKLMGTNYNMTPQEFVDNFHITNAYEMTANGECLAMLFSCEYGKCVYLDNLSYNPLYKKYSCGKLLYAHYLEQLVKKGKSKLFLGDGQQDYKKHFGSIEKKTFRGGGI